MGNETLSLVLAGLSGLCWTVVYIESIRLGIVQKTYAMPFWALALNIGWEGVHAVIAIQEHGYTLQAIVNAVWFIFDIGILYTYFRFGKREFPSLFTSFWFYFWSIFVLVFAFIIQFLFVKEFGLVTGGAYSAFIQNLLMSVLFINMLTYRKSSEGQSLVLAVNKWIGTLAPTILFGYLGDSDFSASTLVFALGIFCSIFDVIYIWLLLKVQKKEKMKEPINILI